MLDETPGAPTAHSFIPGFTNLQARAITEIARAETEVAIEALRRELARWHLLLAAYVLVEIGIAFLAMLLLAMPADRAPRTSGPGSRPEPFATLRSRIETARQSGD